MIEDILVISFNSNPSCLDATAEETISACKNAKKYAILNVDL